MVVRQDSTRFPARSPPWSAAASDRVGIRRQRGASGEPGEVVIVMGVGRHRDQRSPGGVHAGATRVIAVDPVQLKRDAALRRARPTPCSSIDEAGELARSLTNGQRADSAIVTVGVLDGEHIAQAFDAVRKGGTVVVTGVAPMAVHGIPVSPFMLAMFQKRMQGCLYGMMSPPDVPRLLRLYEAVS